MLVLSRRVNECIVIGGNIEVFISLANHLLFLKCSLYPAQTIPYSASLFVFHIL